MKALSFFGMIIKISVHRIIIEKIIHSMLSASVSASAAETGARKAPELATPVKKGKTADLLALESSDTAQSAGTTTAEPTPSKIIGKLNLFDTDWDAPENSRNNEKEEPLLVPNKRRFVLFPIQYQEVSVGCVCRVSVVV
jgi:hypothetical protein